MDTKLFVRKQSGGMFAVIDKSLCTGNIFWVDSGSGTDAAGNGQNPDAPFATIDYAVGKCTANNGDVIYVMPGHNESVTAAAGLDLDVAGITVVFMGDGADRAKITFSSDAGADMDIDAASITLVNPKFVAGVDALTGPIDVNAADFTMINAEYADGTGYNTLDAVIADSTATRMKILGYRFVDGDGLGSQKQSHIQINGCDDIILKDIDIRGDFEVGCVENVTDEVLNARFENWNLENTKAGGDPALFLDANATGTCKNVKLHVATSTTYANSYGKLAWDNQCEGFSGTTSPAGDPLGTLASGGLEGQVSQAVSEIGSVGTLTGSVGTQSSQVLSEVGSVGTKAGSVGTQVSTVLSEVGSVGTKAGSVGTQTSQVLSEVGSVGTAAGSVGTQASQILSEVGSVGTTVSTASSSISSAATAISTSSSSISSSATAISTASSSISSSATTISQTLSEVGSVGTIGSTVLSEVGSVGTIVGSVGTQASTILSEVGSVGTRGSTILSETGSVGTQASNILSAIHSLWTAVSTKLSQIDSQVS